VPSTAQSAAHSAILTIQAFQINYDFAAENTVKADLEQYLQDVNAFAERRTALEEARKSRRLAEVRAKAPGFSGDATILQPIPANTAAGSLKYSSALSSATSGADVSASNGSGTKSEQTPDASKPLPKDEVNQLINSLGKSAGPASTMKGNARISFTEFEQGLAPRDPWDTITSKDDFNELKEVMNATTMTSSSNAQPAEVGYQHQTQQYPVNQQSPPSEVLHPQIPQQTGVRIPQPQYQQYNQSQPMPTTSAASIQSYHPYRQLSPPPIPPPKPSTMYPELGGSGASQALQYGNPTQIAPSPPVPHDLPSGVQVSGQRKPTNWLHI
jgi:hypothetical protein